MEETKEKRVYVKRSTLFSDLLKLFVEKTVLDTDETYEFFSQRGIQKSSLSTFQKEFEQVVGELLEKEEDKDRSKSGRVFNIMSISDVEKAQEAISNYHTGKGSRKTGSVVTEKKDTTTAVTTHVPDSYIIGLAKLYVKMSTPATVRLDKIDAARAFGLKDLYALDNRLRRIEKAGFNLSIAIERGYIELISNSMDKLTTLKDWAKSKGMTEAVSRIESLIVTLEEKAEGKVYVPCYKTIITGSKEKKAVNPNLIWYAANILRNQGQMTLCRLGKILRDRFSFRADDVTYVELQKLKSISDVFELGLSDGDETKINITPTCNLEKYRPCYKEKMVCLRTNLSKEELSNYCGKIEDKGEGHYILTYSESPSDMWNMYQLRLNLRKGEEFYMSEEFEKDIKSMQDKILNALPEIDW